LKRGNEDKIIKILHQQAECKNDIEIILISAWQTFCNESSKARRLYTLLPDVAEKAAINLEIEGGLLHFVKGHGPYKQRLKSLKLVEDNMCHVCWMVSTPEHVVLRCVETEALVSKQRALLGDRPVTEVLRAPELVTLLRESEDKVSAYYKRFLAVRGHPAARDNKIEDYE